MDSPINNNIENDLAAIFMVDALGHIMSWNYKAEQLKGFAEKDVIGKHISIFYPEDTREEEPNKNLLKTQKDHYFEVEGYRIRKDGSQFLAKVIYTAIYDEMENFQCFVVVARDITERKISEEKLKKNEEEFRAILESAPDSMIISMNERIVMVNEKTEVLFGYKREEILGMAATMLIPHHYQEDVIKYIKPLSKLDIQSKEYRLELMGRRKNGTQFPIEISISPIGTAKGILISTAIRDISERKKIEKELQQVQKNLKESLDAKELFLAQMSHEIRTPMNAIIGFTKLALKKELDQELEQYMEAIKTSGENLLVIINDILDISKIKSKKIIFEQIEFSLSMLINTLLDLLIPKMSGKNIQIHKDINKKVPDCLIGDPARLNQILVNLVGNAIKFTDSGYVLLTVDLISELENEVELKFSIKDTGIGIPEDKLNTIFQHFTQESVETSRKHGGTGLGLTIVKQLVELQNGKVWVESEIGKGSAFNFILKFKHNLQVADKVQVKDKADERDFSGLSVLLVEDNILNQILAEKVLNNWQCKVEIAENGRFAIEKLEKDNFDVILMDIQLPEMDGYETTRYIREKMKAPKSHIPIIAMTANAMYGEAGKAIEAGMDDYISKPFEEKDLYDKIQSVLHLVQPI